MKRSELVTKIEEYLLYTEHLDIPCSLGSDFKAAAKELVVLIEQAGMLPPKACIERSVRVGDEERIAYYNTNEWESEDEKK